MTCRGKLGRPWLFFGFHGLCHVLFALRALATEAPTPVVVTLSDGGVLTGELSVIGSRPLTLVPFGENRQRMILLSDILSVNHDIETSSMERPWVFKEAGRADKVYLDGHYPLLNFKTRITLVSGSIVSGHVISAAMTLKSESGKQKLFLQRQIKGALTQTVNDVTYVSGIRMTAQATGGGTISGLVQGAGRVESVTALDNDRGQVLFARVTRDNRFDFGMVLPGRYDLCVLTDTHVLTGLSDAVPRDAAGDALRDGDLAAINTKFPLADDFFKDRWIVGLSGNRRFAKALVYKRRADYYESEKWTPGGFLWHLEVWSWHLAEPDWKVDRRYILIRHKQKGGEHNRKLMTCSALGAVTPDSVCTLRLEPDAHEKWTLIRDLD